MISVTQFKEYCHEIFAIASSDGFEFHVKQRTNHKVYLVSITITNLPYPIRQWTLARRKKRKRDKVAMDVTDCPVCGNPKIAGICVIKNCPGVLPTAEKSKS